MIRKERQIPPKIELLEALLRRLPPTHSKKELLSEELAKAYAGYRGEKSLDYHFDFLPNDKYFIIHDLRIPDSENRYFQLDTLIISACFILIIEVKNISGTLTFDRTFHQLIRELDGNEEAFPDPFLQTSRQESQLKNLLTKYKYTSIPVLSLIVISKPSTIIKNTSHFKETSLKVIHAASLPTKLNDLASIYKEEILTKSELNKIIQLLVQHHSPAYPGVLQKFQIHSSEIITGAHCPICSTLPLHRQRGAWYCPVCKSNIQNAHIYSLKDFYLLISPIISNKQLREFLQLPSISIASKILVSLNLQHSGNFKKRQYELSLTKLNELVKAHSAKL
ncbi:NERD domain-containing protein [Cytobacillus sp. IB215665]|uniref:NERD domain-containing protein n=1 Tax=Cytobacillus sp. IB215665 TaxID=3097357 RepID=UPI002A179AAD|nr:NERD domain-containing protein [Cytobacillus sp. IB215665]MDX8363716.1 NERD domain-containing protein [Cytobacillus sp. IB215665]